MKSNKPLFSLLAGYIFSLLVFHVWYYTTDTPFWEVIEVVIVISALYLITYFLILVFSSLQKPWKSFLLVSIITLATFYLIQNDYHAKYRLERAEAKKLTENIRIINEARMEKLETQIDDANKTITLFKEMLEFKNNENDKLRRELNETIRKVEYLEGGYKIKGDVVLQTKSNKDFSEIKIYSDADNTNLVKENQEIIFKVQIISSKTRLATNSPRFQGLKNVWEYEDSDLYKYTIGNEKDLKSASVLQSEFRRKGFVGAFVVAFKNGKRIPVREAKKLLN